MHEWKTEHRGCKSKHYSCCFQNGVSRLLVGCYHPILLTIKPQLLHVGRKPVTIQPGLPSHPTVPTLSMPYTYQDVCAQLGLTLCDHMNCSLPGSSCPWDSPGKNTGMGCHFLLQEIFPNQGMNSPLLHYRWILYHWNIREALLQSWGVINSHLRPTVKNLGWIEQTGAVTPGDPVIYEEEHCLIKTLKTALWLECYFFQGT